MSTNATISIQRKLGGRVKSIYSHWDGYIKEGGVGDILFYHFQKQSKIEQLLDLGSISSLSKDITAPEGHSFNNRIDGYTVAYGRDRGEKNMQASELNSLYYVDKQEYNYVFKEEDQQWYIFGGDNYKNLILLENYFK